MIKVTKRPAGQRKDTVLNQIAVHELEQLVVYGNVQLTTQAAALLLQKNVDVVFYEFWRQISLWPSQCRRGQVW